MKYPWRESSTVILAALKKPPSVLPWNYKVLGLQRSAESQFMPNGCVFPGGTTAPADSEESWLGLFSKFNVDLCSSTKLTGQVPPIIARDSGKIPKLLSLKITAIRETFEETGVLLCFGKDREPNSSEKWVSFREILDVDSWKTKVQENANEFFNLCQKHDLCPDVNNIHLWSNWLTPTSVRPRRFDTVFFIAFLNETPVAAADNKEINVLNWFSPEKLLELCKKKKIWLPPPQFYEISRLVQFKEFIDLSAFAQNRALQGCERWMPILKKTSDASVTILPGDGAYKETDSLVSTELDEIKISSEEFRNQFEVLHRLEFQNGKPRIFLKNYKPKNGHLLPVEEF